MKIGDMAIINIGGHRGGRAFKGFLPIDMLADGTMVTIINIMDSGWCSIKECPQNYVYPKELLLPCSKKYILLNKIKDFL